MVGDGADCGAGQRQGFDQKPALIDWSQINIKFIKILGGPVYGPNFATIQPLLVEGWVYLLEGNEVNKGHGKILPLRFSVGYEVSDCLEVIYCVLC